MKRHLYHAHVRAHQVVVVVDVDNEGEGSCQEAEEAELVSR